MKTSNKILLGGILLIIVIITVLIIKLKIKIDANTDEFSGQVRNVAAYAFLSARNEVHITATDESKVNYSGKSKNVDINSTDDAVVKGR